MTSNKQPPLLNRTLLVFMATMILANISGRMYGPLFPLYLQSLGATVGQVGLFFTLSMITPLALQIFGGWFSDSLGRLQAIAIGSIGGLAGNILFVLAPSWEWLLLAVLIESISSAFVGPSYQAFIAEQSTEETRGRVFGITESLFVVVGIVGPPLGGYLSQRFGFKWMFIVAAALYGAATVIRLFMAAHAQRAESAARPAPTFGGFKTNLGAMAALIAAGGVVTWILLSDGVRDIAWGLSEQLEPIYMQSVGGLTNLQIGWLVSLAAVANMIFAAAGGWLADKKGERAGIVGGFLLLAAGLAIFLNTRAFAGFVAAWILFGVSRALISPAYSALISKAIPEKLRGVAYGLFSTSVGVVSLPAPYIGGQLWERIGPQAPFYATLAAVLVIQPFLWVKLKLRKAENNV